MLNSTALIIKVVRMYHNFIFLILFGGIEVLMMFKNDELFWFQSGPTLHNILILIFISIVLMFICYFIIKFFLNGYRELRWRRLFLKKPHLRKQDETMWSLGGLFTLFYFPTMISVILTIQFWLPILPFLPTLFPFNSDDMILYATTSYSVIIGVSMFSFYKLLSFYIKPKTCENEKMLVKTELNHKIYILKRMQNLCEVAFSFLPIALLICTIVGTQLELLQSTLLLLVLTTFVPILPIFGASKLVISNNEH